MKHYLLHLIKLRTFYTENFFVNIHCFTNKKKYFMVNSCFRFLLKLIPFIFIKLFVKLFSYQVIYEFDKIYNISGIEQTRILPIVLNFELNYNELKYSVVDKIRYYNGFIPFSFFIYKNKLEDFTDIYIKYILKGKITEKTINLNECKDKLIYNLFED